MQAEKRSFPSDKTMKARAAKKAKVDAKDCAPVVPKGLPPEEVARNQDGT